MEREKLFGVWIKFTIWFSRSSYQIYTAFPFGRIVRDIAQPNKGLIDNPARLLEKFAGMPLRDLQRFTKERKEAIEEGKYKTTTKPGFKLK